MRKLIILVTVLSIGLFLVSCGGSTPATPTAPTTTTSPAATPPATSSPPAAAPIDAKALFASRCAACHGQNRQGTPSIGAPALTPEKLADDSDSEIKNTILKGESDD